MVVYIEWHIIALKQVEKVIAKGIIFANIYYRGLYLSGVSSREFI
jgi:hypothetical protein